MSRCKPTTNIQTIQTYREPATGSCSRILCSRMPRHSCCEMRVMQCMTYFFCTSLQFCTPFRSAQKLYQHPIDIHFFIRFSLTVAKIIILCFYLFPRKCFMFFFQIRNDICDSLSSKRTCHKYLLTTGES